MVQKRILSTIIAMLVFWIVLDLYKLKQAERAALAKLNYLETLNSREIAQTYYETIRKCYTRKSFWINYAKFLNLDPSKVSMDKTFNWKGYIDDEDLPGFTKEITEIPVLEFSAEQRLVKVKNKMIFNIFLNYALIKISSGRSSVCYGDYRIVKDIFHNVTLADYCSLTQAELTVNGVIVDEDNYFPLKLPKTDELVIDLVEPRDNSWLNDNDICQTMNLDLGGNPKKTD